MPGNGYQNSPTIATVVITLTRTTTINKAVRRMKHDI
ncbi:uncharacterized protein METZ01_LOCUS508092, partial [marine metagenome]